MTLAAAGDTWGIPGPTFLVAGIGVAVLSAIHRRILFRGDPGAAHRSPLGPQQVAYLLGDPRSGHAQHARHLAVVGNDKLAVYAAIGGLRAAGAIGSGPDHTLVPVGPLPSGVTPLDVAV